MKLLIEWYIDAHKDIWSDSTLRSERYRLLSMSSHLTGSVVPLDSFLNSMGSYSRVTYFSRAIHFWDWLIEHGHVAGVNEYKKFRRDHRKQFKNVYKRKHPNFSYSEVLLRISNIPDRACQEKAKELLQSGMRFSESLTLKDGQIIGKGGKRRNVFTKPSNVSVPYHRLYKALRKVGLTPHALRKVFATELVAKGANEFELTEIMGWSNLNTAQSYVRCDKNKLESLIRKVVG